MATVRRMGRLATGQALVWSAQEHEPVAQALLTYAIPERAAG